MVKLELIDKQMIRIMIAEQGKNLSNFAKQVEISQSYLTQILNGDRNPSPTVAHKIAEGLNRGITDIFLVSSFAKDNLAKTIR